MVPVVLLLIWFVVALVAGGTGIVAKLHPPLPQVVLLLLTAAALTATRAISSIKMWVESLPLEAFVAVHIVRFVGVYFLILHRQGLLPRAFAVPCGWGDITVAALAVLLLVFAQPLALRPRRVWVWNVFGLLDILFVVFTASRLGRSDPSSMAALLRLPLSLLPTFVVPLIIASHALIFVRLRATLRSPHP